jgi:sugar (pentulose or hexulose) kinase
MQRPPAIAVIDIGRTNRKAVVFDEAYRVLDTRFFGTEDRTAGDGYTQLDIPALRPQVLQIAESLLADPRWEVKAFNFTAYGATIVNLDESGKPAHPVTDYLDPFPEEWKDSFDAEQGPIREVCMRTASPWLGNLNAGLQLYSLRKSSPHLFRSVRHSVFLPQYVSSILTGRLFSELTSIGCHTMTWDFSRGAYHDWVVKAGIDSVFPPLRPAEEPLEWRYEGRPIVCGIGLHDSSSALIPYLRSIEDSFLLLSTGTWSICLNPFEGGVLSHDELESDCLDYLRYDGGAVKASRLPLGLMHDAWVETLIGRLAISMDGIRGLSWDEDAYRFVSSRYLSELLGEGDFNPSLWSEAKEAYHALIYHLTLRQEIQVRRVLSKGISTVYVDGGFSGNPIFLRMLSRSLPDLKVFAAEVGQSTALGAAVVLHESWNPRRLPDRLVHCVAVEG